MQVTRNEKMIKRRAKLGTYATLAGLLVLIGGMVASFQPEYMWLSMIALIVGFMLSQVGNYNLRRWGRNPRPDQALERGLKGFDDRYHFYSWLLPASFVLLSPQGIFTFITRDTTGEVSVNGSQWKTRLTLRRVLLLFASEGLGNPSRDAVEEAEKMQRWVQTELPDTKVPIYPAVVFIDERVKLDVNQPQVPVLEAKEVKRWLRSTGKGENLRAADYRALEQLFEARASKNGAVAAV
jgi:hypothetical protein